MSENSNNNGKFDYTNHNYHKYDYEDISLADILPPGMLNSDGTAGEANAAEALKAIEELINESSQYTLLINRLTQLSEFERNQLDGRQIDSEDAKISEGFTRQLAYSICPDWYRDFLVILSDDEIEVFFKNFITGHEIYGKKSGSAILIGTMLESVAHRKIMVRILDLTAEICEIPDNMRTLLGRQHSRTGTEFILGSKFGCRPKIYHIYVGPFTYDVLYKFQDAGWAEGTGPAEKLYALMSFAEPYYLKSMIHFILAMKGFVIGEAKLGLDKLGEIPTFSD